MKPNFIRKQIGFITDRAPEECAWPCVDRKPVSPDGWTALWKARKMAFGRSKGAMLLGIWRGLNWATVQTFGQLERLIEKEDVKPTLTLSEAKDLVARLLGKSLKKKSPRTILRERLRQFENFLRSILPHCSPAEKQLARATLSRLLEQFGVAGGPDRSPILIKVAA